MGPGPGVGIGGTGAGAGGGAEAEAEAKGGTGESAGAEVLAGPLAGADTTVEACSLGGGARTGTICHPSGRGGYER
jgi:hypothetical protein